MITEIIGIAFKTGMLLGGSFAFFGFVVGLSMNLLNDFGRG